jgi:hypothetical protein
MMPRERPNHSIERALYTLPLDSADMRTSQFEVMLTFVKKIVRTDTFRASAILFGLLNVCFFPCIWGHETLLASSKDAASVMPDGAWAGPPSPLGFSKTLDNGGPAFVTEPLFALSHYEYLHEHALPLWNPYQGYGAPLFANQQSQPFYPLTLAVLVHVSPRTYNWYLLARLFVAGICSYLFLRFFLGFWPALAGGVASMLAGYYLLFISMPQLSVDVLVPASLLAAEYLLRKRDYWATAGFALLLLLVFLGGMPESALVLLILLYAYLLFRIIFDTDLRALWSKLVARLTAATAAGISLSLFVLLPLWELMHRSFDAHQSQNTGGAITGVAHDPTGLSIFTYFFPLIYGPPFSGALGPGDFGLRNYFGIIATFLMLVALFTAISRKVGKDALRPLTFFFVGVIVILELKRYGFPLVNQIGTLPFVSLVNFPKYEEALISMAVATTAAIGLERISRRQASPTVQVAAWIVAALLLPLAYLCSRQVVHNEILNLHVRRNLVRVALAVPAGLMLLLAICLVAAFVYRSAPSATRKLVIGVAALLAADLSMCFIAPAYYWFNTLPPDAHNPYAGAPYINEIRNDQGDYRTFARDGLLFPNWASAFRIADIRNLDALYDKKYFPFLRNFFPDQKNTPAPFDLGDRFNGTGSYDLTSLLAKRLLQLSSVKYIATLRAFTLPNRIVDEILAQNLGHLIPGREANVVRKEFILGDEARDALGEHPPYERMPYHFHVPNNANLILHFSYALDPFVFDKTSGDGVEFILEVRDSRGKVSRLFSKYIDPKHNPDERRWNDGEVDLSAYRGQTVDLLLTTTPGPRGDTSYDWAAWSGFYFEGHAQEVQGQAPPFKLIYNKEAKIYRYDNVLPRAAVFNHAVLANNDAEVLTKLADPTLNVFNSVVLNNAGLTDAQRAMISEINSEVASPVRSASITSYKSQEVVIRASLTDDGILVLNDTDYPGWIANVDGRPAQSINANYMFRAVLLPAGTHVVRFAYRPRSFYGGLAISALTALILVLGAFITRSRNNQRATSKGAAVLSVSSSQS